MFKKSVLAFPSTGFAFINIFFLNVFFLHVVSPYKSFAWTHCFHAISLPEQMCPFVVLTHFAFHLIIFRIYVCCLDVVFAKRFSNCIKVFCFFVIKLQHLFCYDYCFHFTTSSVLSISTLKFPSMLKRKFSRSFASFFLMCIVIFIALRFLQFFPSLIELVPEPCCCNLPRCHAILCLHVLEHLFMN